VLDQSKLISWQRPEGSNVSGKTPPRLLSPELFIEATYQMAAILAAEGAHVALAGGLAMQLYGSDRYTKDVDLLSNQPILGLPSVKALAFGGQQVEAPNGVPVDIIVRDDEYAPLYDKALSCADNSFAAVPVRVVRPEYLAAIKFAAGRAKDIDDLAYLVVKSSTINAGRVRPLIKQLLGVYGAREFDQLVLELRWKLEQGIL
jgi:hypothetical protein